jgi:hypothetical protein
MCGYYAALIALRHIEELPVAPLGNVAHAPA